MQVQRIKRAVRQVRSRIYWSRGQSERSGAGLEGLQGSQAGEEQVKMVYRAVREVRCRSRGSTGKSGR